DVHEEESQLVLPRMVAEGRSFDFAFVDGNHRFDRVFLDLAYVGRLLHPGAVVFVDDLHCEPSHGPSSSSPRTATGGSRSGRSPTWNTSGWCCERQRSPMTVAMPTSATSRSSREHGTRSSVPGG